MFKINCIELKIIKVFLHSNYKHAIQFKISWKIKKIQIKIK